VHGAARCFRMLTIHPYTDADEDLIGTALSAFEN
jgi:hypothetical protein